MNLSLILLLAFGIGVAGGLRSMTAPAAVAWAAHWQWLHLAGTPLAFMGSRWVLMVFTALALMEFVADLLPVVPARTDLFPLVTRVVVGFLTGSCIALSAWASLWVGAIAGVAGAIVGAFGGYHLRKALVQTLRVADAVIAIPEDLVAVGLAWLVVASFR